MRNYINLVQTLLEALDKSQQARLQRAKDLGYNVDEPRYFGTPAGDFDELDLDRTADEDLAYGRGAYTTKDPDAASGYANPGTSWGNKHVDEPSPTVYKVYTRVKNPFDLDKVYNFEEIKRIFTHCFTPSELEDIDLWNEIKQEAYDDFSYELSQIDELETRIANEDYYEEISEIDPDDYEDGDQDEDYKAEVESLIEFNKKSDERKLGFLKRRLHDKEESHKKALAMGRKASATGKEIYKTLWQNTDGYHDWEAESRLFGGETDTIEFKTIANRWLEELGYDGIVHTDYYNPGKKGQAHRVTIAFHPHQIRSAHADFDPEKEKSPKLSD